MEADQFLEASRELSEYITSYITNIRDRRVLPDVEPGYLRPLLPPRAPDSPDRWSDVMADIERLIMPGITHWQSPQFHAFYPACTSYPSILGEMLSAGINCIGFSWIASPACTELEVVTLDWLGQLLALPDCFLAASGGTGGGVIQGSISESTLMALLVARGRALRRLEQQTSEPDPTAITRLVAYTSDQSHTSVERAGRMALVKTRLLTPDDHLSMRGAVLRQALLEDKAKGLIPFFVCSTLGTTPACSFDNLREVGQVAQEFGLWHHVDAAYAGSALVCEEFRYLMDGVEMADTFCMSPHKWLLVNYDCTAMWMKNMRDVANEFQADASYLDNDQRGQVHEYRDFHVPMGRRFRSLKLWLVLRMYGRRGLQEHVRKHVALALQFENYVKEDPRFEVVLPTTLGFVCFRLKGSNEVNEALLKKLTASGVIFLIPATSRNTYYLRFSVCSPMTESQDVQKAWQEVLRQTQLLENPPPLPPTNHKGRVLKQKQPADRCA